MQNVFVHSLFDSFLLATSQRQISHSALNPLSCMLTASSAFRTINTILKLNEPTELPDLSEPTTFATALTFELGLGLVGVFVCWLFGFSGFETIGASDAVWTAPVGLAILLTVPPWLCLLASQNISVEPLIRFREMVAKRIRPMFANCSIGQIALLSISAGVGEELLFRGCVQRLLERSHPSTFGLVAGLILTNLLFGMAHALSWTYFWWAFGMGLYLSVIYSATGDLIYPLAIHGFYDFLALVYIRSLD